MYLLDRQPKLAEQLLAEQGNRKRFSAEKVDWQTLSTFGYDLSSSLGTFLISKADLKNVPAIREAYGALFPSADEMRKKLADRRLWNLNHKRNLIVHKRGVVDQQYLQATGETRAIGEDIWVTPNEVEEVLEVTLAIGAEIVRQVANAG